MQAPSVRSSAEPLEFRDVTKRYPGTTRAGGRRPVARGPRRRDLRARRPVGLRQDDRDADGQPDDRHHVGRHPARRAQRQGAQARGAAPQHRLRHPADRPVPAPHDRREHRDGPEAARAGTSGASPRASTSCSSSSASTRTRCATAIPAQLSGGQRQRVGVARALAVDPPVMLMDEPFGAIDPINRERLQNEFLRLQAELRKTIVFVTHDIDEAIKMGDRIAVLQVGGKLAQYAPPAELLMAPANAVRRGLRRRRPRAQAPRAAARARHRPVDRRDVPRGRADRRGARARRRGRPRHPAARRRPSSGRSAGSASAPCSASACATSCARRADPIVELDDILRDALSDLLAAESMYGPVVDADGRTVGVLSIQVISHAVGSAPRRGRRRDRAGRARGRRGTRERRAASERRAW